ncbi:DUF559 domain-containing protein [Kribbella sandramycini]|uniref:DUF559 domain-containing protein n=1 Tax=Kribbella sandramycini TaxID=60450 RepID=A0A7Y4KYQ9_9ACTN|nr:DUF559 domain-containing protein [Kribbella sandramycini]
MPPVDEVLAQLGGSATTAQLRRLAKRAALERAVADGTVIRVARGVYALPALGPERLAALAYDGVVSHLSAAQLLRLPLRVLPETPHVIVPAKRHPRAGRAAVLHWAQVTADERRARLTSALRTVLDCARILPFGEALAVADAALRSGRVGWEELNRAAHRVSGPGRANVLQVAAAATPLAESFLESMVRSLLISDGIAGFEPQVDIYGDGGFIGRVDLAHSAARVIVEAEGYEFHGSAADFAADCRRYDDLVAAGWTVLRFTYQQVLGDPRWVVATVQAALTLRTGGTAGGEGAVSGVAPGEWAA